MSFPAHRGHTVLYAESRGFALMDQVDHFGYHIPYVAYLHHAPPAFHEYLSLISYEDRVVEVVFERYLAPKNTRRPKGSDTKRPGVEYSDYQLKGYSPIYLLIFRDWDELTREVLDV